MRFLVRVECLDDNDNPVILDAQFEDAHCKRAPDLANPLANLLRSWFGSRQDHVQQQLAQYVKKKKPDTNPGSKPKTSRVRKQRLGSFWKKLEVETSSDFVNACKQNTRERQLSIVGQEKRDCYLQSLVAKYIAQCPPTTEKWSRANSCQMTVESGYVHQEMIGRIMKTPLIGNGFTNL